MQYIIVILCTVVLPVLGKEEIKVMTKIDEHVCNVVLECQGEMGFGKDMLKEFLAYWDPNHALNNTDQGCVFACILKRLDILGPERGLNKANADAFFKANGADAALTEKLEQLLILCKHAAMTRTADLNDGCASALEIAKCFRYGIFSMHWAPPLGSDYKNEIGDMDVGDD